MDPRAFDRLARTFSQSASRRRALGGVLGGALGAVVVGAVGEAKGRQPGQGHPPGSHGLLRGFKFTVLNPLTNPDAYEAIVEFGSVGTGPHLDDGLCCRAEKRAKVDGGDSTWFSTPESSAYFWLDNKYFLYAVNPFLGLPLLNLAINGVTSGFHNPACCKPVGQDLEFNIALAVGEHRALDFAGRTISVLRQADDDDHKVYEFYLDYILH